MNDDKLVNMMRDMVERSLARQIIIDVITEAKSRPTEQQNEAYTSLLHVRLLKEMCDFKDRLNAQAGKLIKEVLGK